MSGRLTHQQGRIVAHLEAGAWLHLAGNESVAVLPAGQTRYNLALMYTTRKTVHKLIEAGFLNRQWRLVKDLEGRPVAEILR